MKRNIDTNIWVDAKVEGLSSLGKLLWIYLLTSPQGNLAGCFELTLRRVEVDTGMQAAQAKKAINELCASSLISYSAETYEVLIYRWSKHNWSSSPKLVKPLISAIASVKEASFRAYLADRFEETFGKPFPHGDKTPDEIPYGYPIDTPSIPPISISKPISIDTLLEEQPETPSQVETRHRHGPNSNVLLTDGELDKLKEKFPNDWQRRIDDLSWYIASKGARYKSHYKTILAWARKDEKRGGAGNASPYAGAW